MLKKEWRARKSYIFLGSKKPSRPLRSTLSTSTLLVVTDSVLDVSVTRITSLA